MAEVDLWQALSDTIQGAVNLCIVTLAGGAAVSGPLDRRPVSTPTSSVCSLVTDINLAAGNITRIVSGRLLGAEYSD